MTTKTITESSNVNHKKVQWPWSCDSAPSQETEQVSHILIHTGFIRLTRGSCRVLPCLGIGLVTRPCELNPKLLWGTTYKRGRTLALLTEDEPVETLMYLHLSMVVGCLLANKLYRYRSTPSVLDLVASIILRGIGLECRRSNNNQFNNVL